MVVSRRWRTSGLEGTNAMRNYRGFGEQNWEQGYNWQQGVTDATQAEHPLSSQAPWAAPISKKVSPLVLAVGILVAWKVLAR